MIKICISHPGGQTDVGVDPELLRERFDRPVSLLRLLLNLQELSRHRRLGPTPSPP